MVLSLGSLLHTSNELTRFPFAMAFMRWKASISCGKCERKARISFRNRIVCRYLTDAIRTFALMSNCRSISGSGRPYLRSELVSLATETK